MSNIFGRARSSLLAATAVAILAIAAPGAAHAAKGVSASVGKVLQDSQKALGEKDYATALAKAKEAQGVSGRTAFDDFTINQFIAAAAVGLKDYATAAAAYEAMAGSSELPPAEKRTVFGNALMLSTAQQNYSKALTYGAELEKMGPLSAREAVYMAQSNYQTKNYPAAQKYAKMSIDASKAAGAASEPVAQQIILSSQISSGDQGAARATLENLVVASNDPAQWSNLIENSLGTKGINEPELLYLMRLRVLTNSLLDSGDFKLMADTALRLGNSVEALKVLESGMSSGRVSAGQLGTTLSRARTDAAKDRVSINAFVASAAKSSNGELDYKASEALFGYGRYADSEAAARRALGKSGVKDKNLAQLSFGMALAAQNKNTEAQAAFAAVGGTAGQKRVAQLWTLYTKRTTGTAAAQ